MSATHYTLLVKYGTKAMNKLQEDIVKDLLEKDRTLVNATDLLALQTKILEVIETYNKCYPRCKPVKANWFDSEREKPLPHYHLSLNGLTFVDVKILGLNEVQL